MPALAVFRVPQCLEGTPLEGISLENILKNVENNNCWRKKEEIAEVQREAKLSYKAYVSLRSGERVARVAHDTSLGYSMLFYWKQGKFFPEILEEHRRSLLPTSHSERIAYAYLLGVYGHNHHALKARNTQLDRTVSNEAAALRVENASQVFGMKARRKGEKVCIQNKKFVKILGYCFKDRFDEFVGNDSERSIFLQGFFDASRIKVHSEEERSRYIISSTEPGTRMNLLKSLFELGIYANCRDKNQQIQIAGINNLHKLYDLKLDQKRENRIIVANFFRKRAGKKASEEARERIRGGAKEKTRRGTREEAKEGVRERAGKEYSIERYYAARREAQRVFEKRGALQWKELTEKFGVEYNTLRRWVADIVAEHAEKPAIEHAAEQVIKYAAGPAAKQMPETQYQHKKPRAVKGYEALLDMLGLPNVYTADEPTERNGKLFFPVEGEVYCLPREAQCRYLSEIGRKDGSLDKQDISFIHREIGSALRKEKGRDLDVKIGPGNLIKKVCLSEEPVGGTNIPLAVRDTIYILTPRARRDFFMKFDLPPEEITPEHIAYIKKDLNAYLADNWKLEEASDMCFKIKGTTITRLSLREEPRGGNKRDMTIHSVGIPTKGMIGGGAFAAPST